MINNNFLEGLAKMLNGESYTVPNYMAFGSTLITPTSADTSVAGEFDRNATTSSRSTYTVKFVGSRTAAEANNETLYNTALVNSSVLYSSGNVQANTVIASIIHSSTFDIDVEYWFTINRG